MSIFYRALLMVLIFSGSLLAQSANQAPTNLPAISLIGNFLGTHSDGNNQFDVAEIELAFQQYLYPGVKADVFIGVEKEADGSRTLDVEEAYVTFASLPNVLMPNSSFQPPIGAMLGKKLLNFGKMNALHSEQRDFVDRPLAHKTFFGEDHGLAAEGGQLAYLLPTPFFSQVEAGYWTAAPHVEEEGAAHSGPEFENTLLLARWWNSVNIKDTELEIGTSYLQGNANATDSAEQPSFWGVDFTYTRDLGTIKQLKLKGEYINGEYGEEGEAKAKQTGYFVAMIYRFNLNYSAGLRYDKIGQHGDEGEAENQIVYQLTRQITETSKFRVQYQKPEHSESVVTAQFIFGMGPHAHVLQ